MFKEAYIARGLLEDNHKWRICLEKAIAMQPKVTCCQLLAVILLTNEVAKSYVLWNQSKVRLYNDVKHKLHHMSYHQADQKILENDIYNYSLWDLNRILVGMGRSLAKFLSMSLLQQQWGQRIPNSLLQAKQYDRDETATLVDKQRAIFNPEQAAAFDAILKSITNNQGYLFFIHTAGGCRKTFLYNTIAAEVRRRGQMALYVVSSGIATLLLDGGRIFYTFYLCFKISFSISKNSVAGLKWNSYMFPVIQQTKVIIWDKVFVQHKYNINTID